MDKKTKTLLILGSIIICFTFSLTSPAIHLHFMQLVSTQIYTIANIIDVALAATINGIIVNVKIKNKLKKFFTAIMIIDCFFFCLLSFIGLECYTVRFIGFAVLNSVSTQLWSLLMTDSINQVINGDELTSWRAFIRSTELWANLAGLLLALLLSNKINLELGIALQCSATVFMACTDYISYKRLNKKGEILE